MNTFKPIFFFPLACLLFWSLLSANSYGQVSIGNPQIRSSPFGGDITDSLTAGNLIEYVSGTVTNLTGSGINLAYLIKLDGVVIASGNVNVPAGNATTSIESLAPPIVIAAGNHTIAFTDSAGVGPVRNFVVGAGGLPVVTIATTDATATEAGLTTGQFTVSRTGPTTAALSVSFAVTGTATAGTDYAALPATPLVIPAGQAGATLTVTPLNDPSVEPLETVTVTLQPNAAIYTLGATTQGTVTIASDDVQSLVLSTPVLNVPEDSSSTFTVRLGSQPAASVTVNAARTAGDTDITVTGGSTLTFTTANWNTPQTVILAAAQDADTANGSATITVSSAGLTSQTVTATEDDDDVQSLVLSTPTVSIPEGNAATFTVRLAFQPAASVTVNTARTAGDTDITVTGGSTLTFTTANWNIPQTVTLSAAQDADTTNGTSTIAVSSLGLASQTLTATEEDDDVQSLVLSTPGVNVPEGNTATFTVRLAFQPAASITVNTARTAGDADISVTGGSSLTFTTANWSTPQTVTFSAAQDADTTNGTTTVTVSSAGLTSQTVTATEQDDDVQSLVLSTPTVSIPEGNTATFTVRLAFQPAASVTVNTARTAGDADITVTGGSTLTFTTANWNIPQTVTLSAGQDADTTNGSATFTVSSAGLTSQTVTATENDEDVPLLVLSTPTLNVPEGSTATFTVRLASQPAASITVNTARTAGDTDITVTGGSALTFTTANWNTPQTVTLSAAQDADTANGSATITVTSAGLTSQTLTAAEVDDDILPTITIEASIASTPETGPAFGEFTVRRTGPVTSSLSVAVALTGSATSGADYSVLPGSPWLIPSGQTSAVFQFSPLHDVIAEGPETVIATLNAGAAYTLGSPAAATVTIQDDDGATNLLYNSSFELGGGFGIPGWNVSFNTSFVNPDAGGPNVHSGSGSLGITDADPQTLNYIESDPLTYPIDQLANLAASPGDTFVVTAWAKTASFNNSDALSLGLDCYSNSGTWLGTVEGPLLRPGSRNWFEFSAPLTVSFPGTASIGVSLFFINSGLSPSGATVYYDDIALLRGGPAFSVSGNTSGQPVWRRPVANGTSAPTTLSNEGTAVPWQVIPFTVSAAGYYTLHSSPVPAGAWDNYLLLYNGTFNPAAPLTNCLLANDEETSGGPASLTALLQPGVNYFAVTTGFANAHAGAYALSATGPGTVTSAQQTLPAPLITLIGNNVQLTFFGLQPGLNYTVQRSYNLQTWTSLGQITSAAAQYTEPKPAAQPTVFYRLAR